MLFGMFIVFIMLLTGCGNKEKTQEKSAPAETAAPKKQAEEISYFATKIYDTEESRTHNIILAISKLNGYTVKSGSVFSFNDAVGKRNEENGYKEANIIVKEEKERGVGGGVCQVSTTLYNAAKLAGLEITERHEHTADVSYIEKGSDAAVSYGDLDLKFKNNTDSDIEICAVLFENSVVAVSILKK